MPERYWNSDQYRWGFQNQEMDNEIKGTGNSVNFKYRVHDPRLGRFLSIDPLAPKYPGNSPYAFSENRVIDSRELEGLERTPAGKDSRYDHLFRGNWTQWKNGYNVWYESSSQSAFKIYHGTTSKITLVHSDMSQGFSISHPSCIIPKMEPIAANQIPTQTTTPTTLTPLPTPNLTAQTTTNTKDRNPIITGIETDMNMGFKGSSSDFLNETDANKALGDVITTLQNNPNIAVNITVTTSLPKGDKDGARYLAGRKMKITTEINDIDKSLWDRITISTRNNETPAVKSEYNTID